MRDTDDGAFADAWNGFNGRFDFGGIDVVATRNDEVLGASGM